MKKPILFFCLFACLIAGAQKYPTVNGKLVTIGGKIARLPSGVTPTPTPPSDTATGIPAEPIAVRTFYLDPVNGDNSRTQAQAQNPGTPWRDFGAVQGVQVDSGTHFVLKGGEYGPSMTAYNAVPMVLYANNERGWRGSKANPIVIKAAPGETPIFTTLATATGATAVAGYPNVYVYVINSLDELAAVRIDNVYRGVTRFPDRTETDQRGYLMGRTQTGGGQTFTATISGITIPSQNIVGADIFTRNNEYVHFAHKITGQTPTSVDFLNMSFAPIENGFGTYFTNHVSFLNSHGEWAVKSVEGGPDSLYVYFSDNQPNNHNVRYATANQTVWSLGTRWVEFRGITFEGSSNALVRIQGSENNYFYNCHWRGSGRQAIFQVNGALNTTIIGGTVKHCNAGAFDLGSEPGTIIERTAVDSVSIFEVRPNFNVEYNNGNPADGLKKVFYDAFWGDAALVAMGNNSKIRFNRITNAGQNGLNWGGANTIVHGNFFKTVVTKKTDAAAIYSYQKGLPDYTAAQTRYITNNIVIDVVGDPGGTPNLNYNPTFGIYQDDDIDRVNVKHNTVANVPRGGFYNHHTQYVNIDSNNVINAEYGYYTRYGDNSSTKLPTVNGVQTNFMRFNTVVSTQSHQIDSSLTVVQQGVFASLQPSQTATFSNNQYYSYSNTREHLLPYNDSTTTRAVPFAESGGGWLNIRTGAAVSSPVTLEAFRSLILARNGPVGSPRITKPLPKSKLPPGPNTPTRTGERIKTWNYRG